MKTHQIETSIYVITEKGIIINTKTDREITKEKVAGKGMYTHKGIRKMKLPIIKVCDKIVSEFLF